MTVFENEEFGKLTAVEIDGEPWFIGKEVGSMLGYAHTSSAISKHCKYSKSLKSAATAQMNLNFTIPPSGPSDYKRERSL